ncbi:MAG: GNAT family N-acetyltransferase [Planctomycetota bacterium]
MVDTTSGNSETGDEAAVEQSWYVPPRPAAPQGWLVYSRDFMLAALQGCATEPHRANHSLPWSMLAVVIECLMAVAQALLLLAAKLPILSWLLETTARVFTRNPTGFFLRACYWKARLRHLGQDTIIDQYTEIWGPSSVSIGSRCHIDTNVRLAAGEQQHLQHGWITIGDFVHVGPGVHVAGRGGVEIGDYVGISANAHLYSATNVVDQPSSPGELISMSHMAPHDQQHIVEAPIIIGDYAFIGMMARIMPGVRVGRGAVVHANVELTRNVPAFSNIGAIPRGRQIGWRRPRRRSPKWTEPIRFLMPTPEGDEPTGALTSVRLREVSSSDDVATISQVVGLHMAAFRDGVLSQLGRPFVFDYYSEMINSERASLWVAQAGDKICGFLGCTVERHAFDRARRSGTTVSRAIWRFLTFRLSPLAVFRTLKKRHLSRHIADQAELLSIAVLPEFRRARIGKRLLNVWSEKLRAYSLGTYIVFTDNPEGIAFYEKCGGERLFRFSLCSLSSACYRLKVADRSAEPGGRGRTGNTDRQEAGADE